MPTAQAGQVIGGIKITAAMVAQWTAAESRLAAAGITGYSVGPGGITIAAANGLIAAQKRVATAASNAAKNTAKAAAHAQVVADNAAAHQVRVAGVVQKNAVTSASAVATQITNFQTHLEALVAQAGKGALTPAFQANFDAIQQQFAKNIAAKGGSYTPIPLAAIAPIVQNSILAGQGVGLTNAAAAAQANALAALYTSGALATYLKGTSAPGTNAPGGTGDNGTPAPPVAPTSPTNVTGGTLLPTDPASLGGAANPVLSSDGGGGGISLPVSSPVDTSGDTSGAVATGFLGLTNTQLIVGAGAIIGVIYLIKNHKGK